MVCAFIVSASGSFADEFGFVCITSCGACRACKSGVEEGSPPRRAIRVKCCFFFEYDADTVPMTRATEALPFAEPVKKVAPNARTVCHQVLPCIAFKADVAFTLHPTFGARCALCFEVHAITMG